MKKYTLLTALLCLILNVGCKKSAVTDRTDELKKLIQGDWYYKTIRKTYYIGNMAKHTEENTVNQTFDGPSFKFNNDNTVMVNGNKFTYQLTSTNGADSLYIAGSNIPKFSIMSIDQNLLSLRYAYLAQVRFSYSVIKDNNVITTETSTSTHIGETSYLTRTK